MVKKLKPTSGFEGVGRGQEPENSKDLQRDEGALQLYEMIFELNGQVYPDLQRGWEDADHGPSQ